MLARKWYMVLMSCLIISLVLIGCAQSAPSPAPSSATLPTASPAPKPTATEPAKPTSVALPKNIGIGTMTKGSVTNILGAGLAKVISAHTGITAVDRPYTGYSNYIPMVNTGELEISLSTTPDLYFAWLGMAPYKEKNVNLRLICLGVPNYVGFTSRKNSSIKFITDAKGKRVGIDPASVSTKALVEETIRANGLDPDKDIVRVAAAGVDQTMGGLREDRLDLCIASMGNPANQETAAKIGGLYWVPMIKDDSDPAKSKFLSSVPYMNIAFLKAGSGPTIENDTYTSSLAYNLSTFKDFSEEAAYQIAKTLWQNEPELVSIYPNFKGWKDAMLSERTVIPYHPGAIRFYKEVGAWNDKVDAVQKKLLGQ